MTRTKNTTRPPLKQNAIYQSVRGSILDGSLKSGERVPPRSAYEEEFGVSSVTVQRAFDRLQEDGFTEVRGNAGTFVSETPPHLWRFGLVFPEQFGQESWSQWYSVLLETSAAIEHAGKRRLPAFMGVSDQHKSDNLRRLTGDIRGRRIAGVMFVGRPNVASASLVKMSAAVPCLVVASAPAQDAETGAVYVDLGGGTGFLRRALDYIVSRGRTRVAHIAVGGVENERTEYWERRATELGIHSEPAWTHGIDVPHAKWAANVVQLLFRRGQEDVPDALVISDDNLVEHCFRGLIQAGVRVGEEVEVVAHCNFPVRAPSVLPVARLGYDTRGVLEVCLDIIDRKNRGEDVPASVLIEPVFDWELGTQSASV